MLDSNNISIGTLTGVVNFGNVILTPTTTGQTFPEGAHLTFNVSLTTGAVPAGANITWTLTSNNKNGGGTINGGTAPVTSTSLKVTYVAPMFPVTDLLEVSLVDKNQVSLGHTSTLINIDSRLSITPDKPIDLGAQQTYTVSGTNGFVLPASASYKWTLTGTGSLPGGSTSTTTSPKVVYTAPLASHVDTLTVQVTDLATATIVAQGTLDINAGIIVWVGSSGSVTNKDSLPILATATVTLKEFKVDDTHVFFTGDSSDTQGYTYKLTCGSPSAPLLVTDNGDGTETVAMPSGCSILRTVDPPCYSTIPITAVIRTPTELRFPGATYVWSDDCYNAKTDAYPFTLYKQ